MLPVVFVAMVLFCAILGVVMEAHLLILCVRAGLLPPGPSGPGGTSVLMLQMAAPSTCPQPRAASPCQRKQPAQHKHSGPEQQQIQQQRGRRAAELALIADGTQVQTGPPGVA